MGLDDITKKAQEFLGDSKVTEALHSEQAEDISDKLLDGTADADQQGHRQQVRRPDRAGPRRRRHSRRHRLALARRASAASVRVGRGAQDAPLERGCSAVPRVLCQALNGGTPALESERSPPQEWMSSVTHE
ncbi:hypothetical protein [Cryobacterium sp. 10C3]|uniref:hypothetical protein n=1 Tax=Cryobacterium sp. 10C3 TaxID=3048577 RepID=UPI002AB4BD76|nr:hypothetical protein [Cryobacterium sp. 10C3]MDY7558721.1 hypothetical protein [Cryobacterium sp. 10C3]